MPRGDRGAVNTTGFDSARRPQLGTVRRPRPGTRAMNLTQSLLHALAARGATEIFGIPGDFALPFFLEIERAQVLPLPTLSHEPGLGFAADAAARARGGR